VDVRFWELAERLIWRLHEESGLPVIACDEKAMIVKSVDPARIGTAAAVADRSSSMAREQVGALREVAQSMGDVEGSVKRMAEALAASATL
jgi:hypothetical protein